MSIRCFDEITSKVEEEEEEKNKPAMIEISLSSVQNTRQSTDANIHVFFVYRISLLLARGFCLLSCSYLKDTTTISDSSDISLACVFFFLLLRSLSLTDNTPYLMTSI